MRVPVRAPALREVQPAAQQQQQQQPLPPAPAPAAPPQDVSERVALLALMRGIAVPPPPTLVINPASSVAAAAIQVIAHRSSCNAWTTLPVLIDALLAHGVREAAGAPLALFSSVASMLAGVPGMVVRRISCACLDDIGYRFAQLGSEPPTAPQPPDAGQLPIAILVCGTAHHALFGAAPAPVPLTLAALQRQCACWGVAPTIEQLAAALP
jgi:hypothetical protein